MDDMTDMEMEIATDELLALVDDLEDLSRNMKKMGNDDSRAEPLIAADLLSQAAAAVRGAAMQISIMRGIDYIQKENI